MVNEVVQIGSIMRVSSYHIYALLYSVRVDSPVPFMRGVMYSRFPEFCLN